MVQEQSVLIEELNVKDRSGGGGNNEQQTTSCPARPYERLASSHMNAGATYDFSMRLYRRFNDDNVMALAASVAFFALLGLFPAITAFVSLYGLFADPDTVTANLKLVEGMLPADALDIVKSQVSRAAEGGATQLSLASVAAMLFALWSANSGTKAIIDALNVIYGVDERRSFIRYNAVSLALSLGAMAVLLLVIAAVVVAPLLLAAFGVGLLGRIDILRWPLMAALVLASLGVLYRFGPNQDHARWRLVSIGSAAAVAAWLAVSALFSWYLSNFANYSAVYGSLGAIIGLMMWMWLSAMAILVGAEVDAMIARRETRSGERDR